MIWIKHKRSFQISALVMILLVVFIALAMMHSGSKEDYVAEVNGERINRAEFERVLVAGRSSIYDYFKQKYGANDSKDFWNTSFNGEKPIEIAKSKALKEGVHMKIQQIQAKQEGVVSDISYAGFIKRWYSENNKRAEDDKNNQPVFGPIKFDEVTFLQKDFGDMVNRVKEKMIKDSTLTDEDYKKYYEANKDKYFRVTSTIKFESIKIPFINIVDGKTINAKTQGKQSLESIQAMVLAGKSFEDSVNSFKSISNLTVDYEIQTLDNSSFRRHTMLFPTVVNELENMNEGDTSQIIEERDAFYLIRSLQKSDVTYKPFEDVKYNVQSLQIGEMYDQLIGKLEKEAQVEINESVYKAIKVADTN